MNFADILEEWDKRAGNTPRKNSDIGDAVEKSQAQKAMERQRRLRKKPDAVLDLHGLTREQAWQALDDFFNTSASLGHEKVLVIHGKGNHSDSEGVLKALVMKFIEHCPFAGQSGHGNAHNGGSGTTWVLLKG